MYGSTFTDTLSGYQWLWNNVQGRIGNQFFVISPSANIGLTDYAVEWKAFIFSFSDISPTDLTQAELNFANTVMSSYPSGTPVLGFFGLGGEGNTVGSLTTHQEYMTVSDDAADSFFLLRLS